VNTAVLITAGFFGGFVAGVVLGVSGTIAVAAVRPWSRR
jgi:hypothetical protein